jgi:hypothetical protein
MRELLAAIDAYFVTSDAYDRTHSEQARVERDRRRNMLRIIAEKYKKAEQAAALAKEQG